MKKTFPPAPPMTKAGTMLSQEVTGIERRMVPAVSHIEASSAPPKPVEVPWADDLWAFEKRCKERLLMGQEEYGNKSFEKPHRDLLREMQEEYLDAANYAFMGWRRLELLREALPDED